MTNLDELGAASVDYAMFCGYLILAYLWARMAEVAMKQLDADGTQAFYTAKLATARFYYRRILPRTDSLATAALAGADTVMGLDADAF
jgi:hypothetical protein